MVAVLARLEGDEGYVTEMHARARARARDGVSVATCVVERETPVEREEREDERRDEGERGDTSPQGP